MEERIRDDRGRLQLFPAHQEAFDSLSATLHEAQETEALADLYLERLTLLPDSPGAVDLRQRLGELYLNELDQQSAAREQFESVLRLAPDRWDASEALETVLFKQEAWSELAAHLRRRVAVAEGTAKAPILIRLAELQAEHLQDAEGALQSWRAAFAVDHSRHDALANARGSLRARGRLSAAARLLLTELEADAVDLGAAFLMLGRELLPYAWYRDLCKRLLDQAAKLGEEVEVESLLEPYAGEAKSWRELARGLRAEAVDARDKHLAADCYLRIAQLHARYGEDAAKVRENLERVFMLDPSCLAALDFLEDFHKEAQDSAGLAEGYQQIARAVKDRQMAAEALLRLSRVREQQQDDPEGARAALGEILEIDPGHAVAATALASAYKKEGAFVEAVKVLEGRLQAGADRSSRVRLHRELASIAAEELDDAELACKHLEAAMDLDPGRPELAAALEKIYFASEAWEKVARMMERVVGATPDPEERARLLETLAHLAEDKLQDPARAAAAVSRLLALEPSRKRAVSWLKSLAVGAEQMKLYASGLAIAAEFAEGEKRKSELWHLLGEVLEEGERDLGGAAQVYRRILDANPGDAEANEALERVLLKRGDPGALAEALEDQLRAEGDSGRRRQSLLKLAHLQLESLGKPSEAASSFGQVLEDTPSDLEAHQGRVDALLALRNEEGSAQDSAAVVQALTEARAQGIDLGVERSLRIVAVLEEAGQNELADQELLRLEEEQPNDASVTESLKRRALESEAPAALIDRLAARLAAAGEWSRLLQLLESRLELCAGAEKVSVLKRIADLQETRLADKRAALLALGRAASLAADEATLQALLVELRRLAEETGAWSEYEAVLGRVLDAAIEQGLAPSVLSAIRLRRAHLRAEVLGDASGALSLFSSVLENSANGAPEQQEALRAIAAISRDSENWEGLRDALATLLELLPAAERGSLYCELAEVELRRLNAPEQAEAHLREALENEGGDEAPVLALLAEALEAPEKAEALAEVVERQAVLAREAGDNQAAGRLQLKAAKLAGSLGHGEEAVEALGRVLAERPGDPEARDSLLQHLEDPTLFARAAQLLGEAFLKTQEFEQVEAMLERELVALEGEAKGAQLQRLSHLQATELHNRGTALGSLLRAIAFLPPEDQAGVKDEIEALARSVEDGTELIEVLDAVEGELEGAALLLSLRLGAQRAETSPQGRAIAVARYERLVELDPSAEDLRASLHDLYRLDENWAALHALCLEQASQATQNAKLEAAVSSLREAGRVAEERLEDLEAAAQAHRQVLEQAPSDAESARTLDRLYQKLGKRDDLAWVIELQRQGAEQPDRRRDLTFRLAELKREGGAYEDAMSLYREVLSFEASFAPAREALEALVRQGGGPATEAFESLDAVLQSESNFRAQVDLREARLAGGVGGGLSDEAKALCFEQMRGFYSGPLAAPEMAFMVACRQIGAGVELDAAAEAAITLVRAGAAGGGAETGSYEDLWEVLEDAAQALEEGDPRCLMLWRRAAELRTQHGAAEEAIEAWKRVQSLAPDSREVLDELEALYNLKADAKNLVELYRTKVELASTAAEIGIARLDLAKYLEQSGSFEQAIDAFEMAAVADGVEGAARVEALRALERLYMRDERVQDQARILASLVKELDAKAERFRFLVRLAGLFEQHDASPARALELYSAIADAGLEEDPSGPGQAELGAALTGLEKLLEQPSSRARAAACLEPHFRLRAEGRKLVEVIEVRLETEQDPKAREEALEEIAGLYEERVGQPPLAFMVWCRALRETPAREQVVERLEGLAEQTEAWEELAGLYQEVLLNAADDASWRLPMHQRCAAIFVDRLSQPSRAIPHLREVAMANRDPVALEAFAVLLRESGSEELIEVDQLLIEASDDELRCSELWLEIAGVAEASQPVAAVAAFRALLAAAETPDPALLLRLGRVLSELERWEELCEVLEQEVALAAAAGDSEAESQWRFRWGRVLQVRLGRLEDAVDVYALSLSLDGDHSAALGAIEEILAAGVEAAARPAAAKAAKVLRPRYEAGADSARLIKALEILGTASEEPEEQSGLLLEIAEIYSQTQGSPEMAFMTVSRALSALPWNRAALARLAELSEEAELHEEEAELLESLVTQVRDEAVVALYHRRLGLLMGEAGEVEEATRHYQLLLEIDPRDAEALDRLARLTRLEGDLDAHIEVLRRQIDVSEDSETKARLLRQVAVVQGQHQGDVVSAIQSWRKVIELDPAARDAFSALDELLVKQERWTELEEVLRSEAELAALAEEVEAQVAFFHRLAGLKDGPLRDPEGALVLHREVLKLSPGHEVTVTRIEEILHEARERVDLARLLEEVYRERQSWPQLLTVLDVRASHEPEREVRLKVLMEMVEIQERRLDSPEMAFILLCRAFNESPTDAGVRGGLERLAELTEQHEELVAVYEDAIEEIGVPEVLAEMSLTVARIYETRLEDADSALQYYEQVKKLAPDNLPALQALDRLYRRREDWHDLAQTLSQQVELTSDPEERVAVLFRLGQLCAERLAAPDRAVTVYEQLLEAQPGHLPALRSIEQLYRDAGAFPKLAENLETQLELARDDSARERLQGRLAEVVGGPLGEHARGIQLWQEVLELNKRSEAALSALEGLYEASEQWELLATHLRGRLDRTIDPREITRLNDRLGWVMGSKLGQAEDAISSFRAVLERDPRNHRALEALRDIYEAQEAWSEQVMILKRLVPLQETVEGQKAVRLRLAEVYGRRLKNRAEAVEACRRFVELEPQIEEELTQVEALLLELEAPAEAVKVMEVKVQTMAAAHELEKARAEHEEGEGADHREAHVEELAARRVLQLFEIARLYDEEIGRSSEGADALEEILHIDSQNSAAFATLRTLYEEHDRWRDLVALLGRRVTELEDTAQSLVLQREIASLQEKRLGQKDMAFLVLGRALIQSPEDEELETEISRLASETDAWEEYAAVLEEVAEDEPAGPTKERLYLRLAEIHDKQLDDPEEAEASIRKVLSFDPGSQLALERLAGLFVARGQARDLIIALEQSLEVTGEPDEQASVLARIAGVYEEGLEDLDEAIAAWKRVLELDGRDARAIENLARIYQGQEDWAPLVAVLERAAELDPERRSEHLLRVGQIAEDELKDDEAAIRAWTRGLEHDPTHEGCLSSLERSFTRLERWTELLKTYEAQALAVEEGTVRVSYLLKVAALNEDQFDDGAKALEAFEAVLSVDPKHTTALAGQIRHLRALGHFERLIAALEIQLSLTREEDEAVRVHLELGRVWHEELNRVDKAETLFSQALEIDPESKSALRALGELYEKSGNWTPALEMMKRESVLLGESPEAVVLYHRMGKIQEDMLLDASAAREQFEHALEIDAAYLPAIQSLKSLSELEKDWNQWLQAAEQEALHTEDLARKTRLLHEIGVFYRDEREDLESAARYFEEALTKTEDDAKSAEDASALALEREDWERAEQLLEIVCRKQEEAGLEAESLCQRWYKLGYVREKLERHEAALEAFERAYAHDATYLPSLEGLGAALVRADRWEDALKVYQAILVHHRDSVTDLEVVEYHWQIGEIQGKLAAKERSRKSFEKALEIDSRHAPSLTSLVRLLEEDDEWEEAIDLRTRLLETLEPDDRYEMYLAIGQSSSEKLMDPYSAIDAYVGAQQLRPAAVAPMQSLLLLYRETRQAQKAVATLDNLLAHTDVQADTQASKRYEMILAEIYRDDLKKADEAVEHYDRALDLDYTLAQALAAIEQIFAKRKRWQDLEQAYTRMIQRIPKGPGTRAVRVGLWRALGELYRKALRNLDGAIAAYQVVSRADPDDIDAIETYASLLAEKPGAEAEAIAAFEAALRVTDEPARVARALLRLHSARKSYDRAYCVSSVINVLIGNPEASEQDFYERIKPFAPERASRSLTDRLWEQQIYHPELKAPVAQILAILYEQAGSEFAVDLKTLGVNLRKDRLDIASSPLYFANMYRYIGRVLGMEGVPLYRRPTQQEGLAVEGSWPLCLVASEEMLGRSSKRELWFAIAKAMAFCRPELALGRVFNLETLDLLAQSGASLVQPGFATNLDPREVQKMQRRLQRVLSPEAVQALSRVVQGWRPDRALADLRAYAEAVEHTANRAGILLAGDVEVARACLMEDRGGAAKLPLRTKVRDLVMFCLSEEFFRLREALGLAVQIPS